MELFLSNGPNWAKEYAISKPKTDRTKVPVGQTLDPEVISFRAQFDEQSLLDEIVREGARRMLQTAVDAEVDAFVAMHADRTDEHGRRLVVKNGSLPERDILTGAGAIPVTLGGVSATTILIAKNGWLSRQACFRAICEKLRPLKNSSPGFTSKEFPRVTSTRRCSRSSASVPPG